MALLDDVLHELESLHGLYCTDLENEISENHFRLDLSDLIEQVREVKRYERLSNLEKAFLCYYDETQKQIKMFKKELRDE